MWDSLTTPAIPSPRYMHTAAWDAVGQRLIVFGGSAGPPTNDTWALSSPPGQTPTWNNLLPAGNLPPVRYGAGMVYDSRHSQILLYGGRNLDLFYTDVWALSLTGTPTWSELSPSGALPSPRLGATVVFDSTADRLLVFGGFPSNGVSLNDAWELSLDGAPTWQQLQPSGALPTPRYEAMSVWDPLVGRLVVYAGFGDAGPLSDVWQLIPTSQPAWTRLTPAGPVPAPRYGAGVDYDALHARMVLFGGADSAEYDTNETWALNLTGPLAWTKIEPVGAIPGPRVSCTATYDPVDQRLLMFGGIDYTPENATWALALTGAAVWTLLIPANLGAPPPLRDVSAIYDPVREQLVFFGGSTCTGTCLSYSVWALPLTGPTIWTNVSAGLGPRGRTGAVSIYDPLRDRMLVFGGYGARTCGADLCGVDLNDLWALNFSNTRWQQLTPLGTPPSARKFAAGVYDPIGDRLILFGGTALHGGDYNDVWALSLSGTPTWTQLTPQGTPPLQRSGHVAIYDPVRARLVVFGGFDLYGASRNDTWALSLNGPPVWTALQPLGPLPAARAYMGGVYDPLGDRLVICDGQTSFFHVQRDTWGLSLAGSGTWSVLTPSGSVPAGRCALAAIYDAAHARMVMFGGTDSSYVVRNDVWALTFDQPTAAVLATGAATALTRGVRLAWHLSGVTSSFVTVLRRTSPGAWQPLARVARTRDGRVDYIDGTAARGVMYSYALLLDESGLVVGEVTGPTGDTAVRPTLLCYPNPSRSEVTVRLYLPEALHAGTLRIFDCTGRESLHRALRSLDAGIHDIALPSSARLPAGQYEVQCQSANAVTRGTFTRLK